MASGLRLVFGRLPDGRKIEAVLDGEDIRGVWLRQKFFAAEALSKSPALESLPGATWEGESQERIRESLERLFENRDVTH